jgi:HNH endonuclease
MKKKDIKRHLQDYSIYGKRSTTIAHAFASALSVADIYDERKIDEALKLLGQDPNKDLLCVYCDQPAETWDHIMAIVKNGKFSGYGHQVGNLIPCCKDCNSKKGNRNWKNFLITKRPNEGINPNLIDRIETYIKNNTMHFEDLLDEDIKNEIEKLEQIKEQVCSLFKTGDEQAKIIREKLRQKSKNI